MKPAAGSGIRNRSGFARSGTARPTSRCVAVVLVGVIFSVLQLNNYGVSNGAINTRVQMQYETVVERIGFNSRRAAAVLDGNTETWNSFATGAPFVAVRTDWIEMYDETGTLKNGYKIEGEILKEWVSGQGYIPFLVGGSPVRAVRAFALAKNRKEDTVMLRVFSESFGLRDTTAGRREHFISRN